VLQTVSEICRAGTGARGNFVVQRNNWGRGFEQGKKETKSLFAKQAVKTEQLETVIGPSSFQLTPLSLNWDDKMVADGQTTTSAYAHFSRNTPGVHAVTHQHTIDSRDFAVLESADST